MLGLVALVALVSPMTAASPDAVDAPEDRLHPVRGSGLPETRQDVLFVGDSVTAGVYLMSLSDELAAGSWANRLLERFDIPPDLPRLSSPAPADFPGLVRDGWGFEAWRYVASALPWALGGGPRFAAGEPRSIVAIPGQTVREVLHQSSLEPGHDSTGWILGRLLLPEGLTAIETAETSSPAPAWAVVWIGNNDVLASLGMVGSAVPPDPDEFSWHYEVLATRLRARFRAGVPASHLLVCTLPDVTRLPLWQPLPPGARDEHGVPWPDGSVASAFLLAFRDDRFRRGTEAFSPATLDSVRARIRAYNGCIRSIAERHGYTVVDLGGLMDELADAPDWNAPDSPWFSPDLHHPSGRTHREIARRVEARMFEVAGATPPGAAASAGGTDGPEAAASRPSDDPPRALPRNELLTGDQRARAIALMRGATLGGHYPPRPTVRVSLELAAQAGSGRLADGGVALLVAIERPALPAATRWNSRAFLAGRLVAIAGDPPEVPEPGVEARFGWALEPIGAWHWQRWEAGARWARGTGSGWWARGEWRFLFAEVAADGWVPARFETGVRWGTDSRPGHHGN